MPPSWILINHLMLAKFPLPSAPALIRHPHHPFFAAHRYADPTVLQRAGLDAPTIDMDRTAPASANQHRFFRVDPPVIVFTDYAIGETHELAVLLYNDSTVGRRVRVVPPVSGMCRQSDEMGGGVISVTDMSNMRLFFSGAFIFSREELAN